MYPLILTLIKVEKLNVQSPNTSTPKSLYRLSNSSCLFEYTAEPACSAELDRVMKITDEVLKHMIVREDEK